MSAVSIVDTITKMWNDSEVKGLETFTTATDRTARFNVKISYESDTQYRVAVALLRTVSEQSDDQRYFINWLLDQIKLNQIVANKISISDVEEISDIANRIFNLALHSEDVSFSLSDRIQLVDGLRVSTLVIVLASMRGKAITVSISRR